MIRIGAKKFWAMLTVCLVVVLVCAVASPAYAAVPQAYTLFLGDPDAAGPLEFGLYEYDGNTAYVEYEPAGSHAGHFDGSIAVDAGTATLVLDGFAFTTSADVALIIADTATIELVGNNSLTTTSDGTAYALSAAAAVDLSGTGSLTVTASGTAGIGVQAGGTISLAPVTTLIAKGTQQAWEDAEAVLFLHTVLADDTNLDGSAADVADDPYSITYKIDSNIALYVAFVPASREDLTVTLEAKYGGVRLTPMTPESGYEYLYFAGPDSVGSGDGPAYGTPKAELPDATKWESYEQAMDITGTADTALYVQVVKYHVAQGIVVGWGYASATPLATTPGGSSGLVDVTTFTLFELTEEITTTEPVAGQEYVIQRVRPKTKSAGEPDDPKAELGFHQQSSGMVTITLGTRTEEQTNATVAASYIRGGTPNGKTFQPGDVFFLIGGNRVAYDDINIFQQSAAFISLFDTCGGTYVYNAVYGNQYGCTGSGEKSLEVYLFEYNVYELNGIDVTLKSDVRYAVGAAPDKNDINKVTGTFIDLASGKSVTAELDLNMITGITFVHQDGSESDAYAAGDKLKVTVKDQTLVSATPFTATVNIVYSGSNNNSSGGSGSGTPAEPAAETEPEQPAASVTVDGKEQNIGNVVVDQTTGTTTITLDQEIFEQQLETASNDVVITIPAETNTAVAGLMLKNIEQMANNGMSLTVQTAGVSYVLPAGSVDTSSIMSALGAEKPEDVTFNIEISATLASAASTKVEQTVQNMGVELVVPALEFRITASYGGKTYEVETFSGFVSRTIEITEEQAKKITTALVIEPDGTGRHVPTYVFTSGGKWHAKINCLTNSTYVLIYNYQTFEDVSGKWYGEIVTELASRKIITGVSDTSFEGERGITRAEFAAIVVRALGLPANGDASQFTDVAADAWYAGAVGTAYQYGLIEGKSSTHFAPSDNITRQEAMTLLQRTAKLTGFAGDYADYSTFADYQAVSDWASEGVRYCVGSKLVIGSGSALNPQNNITRAEAATIVLRMLRGAELVDPRSEIY